MNLALYMYYNIQVLRMYDNISIACVHIKYKVININMLV